MRGSVRFVLPVLLALFMAGCSGATPGPWTWTGNGVKITDRGSHYEVVLDYGGGLTPRQLGSVYGTGILAALPAYESLTDGYIAEVVPYMMYFVLLVRLEEIKPQIDTVYREEIEGIASRFAGGQTDLPGDGKLSVNELYLLNIFPDAARWTQCSAVSVFGARSASGQTIVARNLDWLDGSATPMAKTQAVVTIRHGAASFCSIGYLGLQSVLTGFNQTGLFAAILSSTTGEAYPTGSRRSYVFDLRHALENCSDIAGVASYMGGFVHYYVGGHLVCLADISGCQILENDPARTSALRASDSVLHPGVNWDINGAVGAVNSFLLPVNHDNHTGYPENTNRWSALRSELAAKGENMTAAGLKEVISFDGGDGPGPQSGGDLYNEYTQQSVVFTPADRSLEVFFRPKSGGLPPDPAFERVQAQF